jgi:hypothetical protein
MNFLQLPAYQVPGPLNFSPVMQALESNQQNALAQRRLNLEDQRVGFEGQRLQFERERAAREAQMGPLHVSMLQQQIAHLKQQGANEAQLAPLQQELTRQHAALFAAQAKQAGEKSETDAAIGGLIRNMVQPGAPAQPQSSPQQPLLRPQSWSPQTPMPQNALMGGDPNLIRVADEGQPAPQSRMVNTPLGPMSQDNAKRIGLGLALAGKGDAGKMMHDSSADFGKEGSNEIDKALINRFSDLSELDNVSKQFRPEYQQLGTQLKAKGLSIGAWLGSNPSQENTQFLNNFARYRAATSERLNQRIKAMAGTAVSGAEEKRMMTANPNAGTGIADGDDPITFKAKLDEQIHLQKMALARFNWLKTQGYNSDAISKLAKDGRIEGVAGLDDMRSIYEQRGQQLLEQFTKRGVPPDKVRDAAKAQLKREFGI